MHAFKPYASGSKGNLYTITDGDEYLIIEAGLTYKEMQKDLEFNFHEVKGLLISHSHKDHCKGVEAILKIGIEVYMTEATRAELDVVHHRINIIEPFKQFTIGEWRVLPFPLEHDVENMGFLIQDKNGLRTLYATDTYYIEYKFQDIHIMAVECNYSNAIIKENVKNGRLHGALMNRIRKSHFSLENYLKFIEANDINAVREIWLLHLSDSNSNAKEFVDAVQKVTGKPVYIA